MNIFCKYDALVAAKDLKGHPKNPNVHPEEQIVRLARILKSLGWRKPITISKRSGFITTGHGCTEAAWLNGWKEVPVSYQDYESDEEEYAHMTSDNAIAAWAQLDLSAVNVDIVDLGPDFDIDLLGIKDFVLDMSDKNNGDDLPDFPEADAEKKIIKCPGCGGQFIAGTDTLLKGPNKSRRKNKRQ